MKQDNNSIYKYDVNKAWDNLYAKLEKDRLLPAGAEPAPGGKRKIPLLWIAAAAVCAAVIFSIFYFPRNKPDSLLVLQNKESSGTWVAMLDDGSTVYLAPNASISCPPVFDSARRKVKLSGNALFSVTKDEHRPFVIETDEGITIEVVGTFFAVQSSSPGSPFELSVKQGKVNVRSGGNQPAVSVEAGEMVRKNTDGLNKFKILNSGAFSRFTDKMCFKDEKLNNIVHAINTVYGAPVVIADQSLNNRILTVTFENDSVAVMSQLICMALNLEQVNKQDTIFIRQSLK